MPSLRVQGFDKLRLLAEHATRPNDRELSEAVHSALITELRAGFVPEHTGATKAALLNRKDRHHVWRWNAGKFQLGAKGGKTYNRKHEPKGNIARAVKFQSHRITFRSLAAVAKAIAKVLFRRREDQRLIR